MCKGVYTIKVNHLKLQGSFHDFLYFDLYSNAEEILTWDEFASSRSLLKKAFYQNNLSLNPLDIDYKSKILGHKWSLSHTKGASVFFLLPEEFDVTIQSIGIDIESRSRSIPKILHDKFLNTEDLFIEKLNLWVIKEAAYKAISNYYKNNFDLIDIVVKNGAFYLKNDPSVKGKFFLTYKDEFIISTALVYV